MFVNIIEWFIVERRQAQFCISSKCKNLQLFYLYIHIVCFADDAVNRKTVFCVFCRDLQNIAFFQE